MTAALEEGDRPSMEPEEGAEGVAGWPLGLRPVTFQMRLANAFSAAQPNAFLGATPTCSSLASSDMDTEQSSLFSFPTRSITLGSLMGMRTSDPALMRVRSLASSCSHSIVRPDLGRFVRRRQLRRIAIDSARLRSFFIRCATCINKGEADQDPHSRRVENAGAAPSLSHFLQADRRHSSRDHRVHINIMYEGGNAGGRHPEQNPLFEEGAPSDEVCVAIEAHNEASGHCMMGVKKRLTRKHSTGSHEHGLTSCATLCI